MSQPLALRRWAWHPLTLAGCLGALAAVAAATVLRAPELGWFAWGTVGTTAGFATSGSV